MDDGLIAMRMRLSGGAQVEEEAGKATAAVEETSAATEAANKKVAKTSGAIGSSLSKQISTMRSVGRSLTKYITVPLAAIAIGSGVMAAHFDRSVLLLHTQAGVAKKDLAGLEKSFLKISRETTFSPTEVSDSAYRLAGAGLRGKALENATRASAQLAMVGGANPEETAKTIAQVWYQQIKGAGDFNHIIKETNATVGAGDLRLSQLIDALGTGVVASAKQAGLSMQDVNAAMAVFGDSTNNVSGWSAQFATALHYFTSPGEKAASAMETLGLKQFQLSADLAKPHGLVVMLKDLKTHLDAVEGGLHGTRAKAILGEILPGGRGRVMLSLLNAIPKLEEKYKRIKATSDEFNKSLRETENTPQVKMEHAWANIQASMVEIGQVLLPIAVPLLNEAAGYISDLGQDFAHLSPSTQHWVLKIGLIAGALGPVLVLVAKLLKMWETIRSLSLVTGAAQGLGELGAAGSLAMGGELGGFAMLSKRGKLTAGALGVGASQLAGHEIGGKAGSVVSDVGTGAAIGFGVGGPLGAAVGATAGAVKAAQPQWEELFHAIFGGGKKVTWTAQQLQRDSKNIASGMRQQRAANLALIGAENRVQTAQAHRRTALGHLHAAQGALNTAIRQYGPNSREAIAAERKLAAATSSHRRALESLHKAEHLRGVELSEFKTIARSNVLEERNEINVMQRKAAHLNNEYESLKKAGASQSELKTKAEAASRANQRLSGANKHLAETITEVAQKAGPKFATFLRNGERQVIEAGSQWKAFNETLRESQQLSETLAETGFKSPLGTNPLGGPMPEHAPHKGHHRNTADDSGPTTSKALAALLERPRGRGGSRIRQPLVIALDKRGRKVIAEASIDVQEDEDARA